MSILSVQTAQVGLAGVLPSISYINTTDTIAEVTTTGYLNKEVANGTSFQMPCIAMVATKATPTSASVVGTYNVVHSGENWSLAFSSNNQISLPNSQIFVGSAANIATPVAMSGDVGINNAGLTTIQPGAVDLAMLSAGITPYAVVRYAQLETTIGGAAGEQFFSPGLLDSDFILCQMQNNGPNNVTILEALPGADLLTITFSADPGAGARFYYAALRLAS